MYKNYGNELFLGGNGRLVEEVVPGRIYDVLYCEPNKDGTYKFSSVTVDFRRDSNAYHKVVMDMGVEKGYALIAAKCVDTFGPEYFMSEKDKGWERRTYPEIAIALMISDIDKEEVYIYPDMENVSRPNDALSYKECAKLIECMIRIGILGIDPQDHDNVFTIKRDQERLKFGTTDRLEGLLPTLYRDYDTQYAFISILKAECAGRCALSRILPYIIGPYNVYCGNRYDPENLICKYENDEEWLSESEAHDYSVTCLTMEKNHSAIAIEVEEVEDQKITNSLTEELNLIYEKIKDLPVAKFGLQLKDFFNQRYFSLDPECEYAAFELSSKAPMAIWESTYNDGVIEGDPLEDQVIGTIGLCFGAPNDPWYYKVGIEVIPVQQELDQIEDNIVFEADELEEKYEGEGHQDDAFFKAILKRLQRGDNKYCHFRVNEKADRILCEKEEEAEIITRLLNQLCEDRYYCVFDCVNQDMTEKSWFVKKES